MTAGGRTTSACASSPRRSDPPDLSRTCWAWASVRSRARARFRFRLRPAVDVVGHVVARRQRLALDDLPAQVVEHPGHDDAEPFDSGLDDARGRGVVDRLERPDVRPRPELGRDPVALRAVHGHGDRAVRDARLDQHAVGAVVLEPQVETPPRHGGLETGQVARDVERVAALLDALEAGVEGRVPHRRGDRRDATTQLLGEATAGDDGSDGVAVLDRPLLDRVVHAERLSRHEQRAVDVARGSPDVRHAVGRVGERLGERRDDLLHAEGLGPRRGQRGLDGLDAGGRLATSGERQGRDHGRGELATVDRLTLHRSDHHWLAAADPEGRVLGLLEAVTELRVDHGAELLHVHPRLERAVRCGRHHQGRAEVAGPEHDRPGAVRQAGDGERDRSRHGRDPEAVHRLLHGVRAHGRGGHDDREDHRVGRAVEVRGAQRRTGSGAVQDRSFDRVDGLRGGLGEGDRAVRGGLVDLGRDIGQVGGEGRLVDGHHGLQLVAGDQPREQGDRVVRRLAAH